MFGTKTRKSICEIRFEKGNMKIKFFQTQNSKIDFLQNEIRTLRFPKFKNRFENSESILETIIYKNP